MDENRFSMYARSRKPFLGFFFRDFVLFFGYVGFGYVPDQMAAFLAVQAGTIRKSR
jgi:hypothetical protein